MPGQQGELYFGYGANVHPAWLRRRVPAAELLGPALLTGYRIAFRKRGQDGAARSDACRSAVPGAELPGALYRLPPGGMARLGAAGAGYVATQLAVETSAGPQRATAWIALPEQVEEGLLPWDWYLGLIRAGARLLDFPASYQHWLANVPVMVDPDAERARPARELLAAVTGAMAARAQGRQPG